MTMRQRRAALVVFAVFILAACDPGFSYWIQNDSGKSVIVLFDGQAMVVPAGGRGMGTSNLGVYDGSIEVADTDCRTTTDLEATTQTGLVVIDASGVAHLQDLEGSPAAVFDALPADFFEQTERCVGRVQPAAPGEALSARAILFLGGTGTDLFRIDSSGSGLTQLTDRGNESQGLTVSSDGRVVAFDGLASSVASTVFTQTGTAKAEPVVAGARGGAIAPDGKRLRISGAGSNTRTERCSSGTRAAKSGGSPITR